MPIDANLPYDDQNILAKILRGEIPNSTVYEDKWALALHDINPQAPVHVLVIPKGSYVSWDDFGANASDAELAGFARAVSRTARELGLAEGGYRVISNIGMNAHQEIAHLHVHILAGKALGPLLSR